MGDDPNAFQYQRDDQKSLSVRESSGLELKLIFSERRPPEQIAMIRATLPTSGEFET
jgi:hypothetical protein